MHTNNDPASAVREGEYRLALDTNLDAALGMLDVHPDKLPIWQCHQAEAHAHVAIACALRVLVAHLDRLTGRGRVKADVAGGPFEMDPKDRADVERWAEQYATIWGLVDAAGPADAGCGRQGG